MVAALSLPVSPPRFLNQKSRSIFHCVDAHTCGNPVRLVIHGGPDLAGEDMAARRLHFMKEYNWILKGLMFEPRGHDMMSGSILYPPADPANDIGVLFIETSGCLPMCGHGTIGTITAGIETGIIQPKEKGKVRMETPAGLVLVTYIEKAGKVISVKLRNVPSFLHSQNLEITSKHLGDLKVDVAYGGNFYAIVDPQENYKGLENYKAEELIFMARELRSSLQAKYDFVHPLDARINGLSHILWTGAVLNPKSTARNAVFYGDKAIDRSPCGTGTSARVAQWHAQAKLKEGEDFIHESYIGSTFTGKVEEVTELNGTKAIIPSIEGWAKVYGENIISIDPNDDPYAHGFQVI
ncbi:proline racemase [Spirosomataceae bacterium TFI 002]|nr:proline racemase [Spirosomataceae bacterium TFI 002]